VLPAVALQPRSAAVRRDPRRLLRGVPDDAPHRLKN
jgi:hypothetical protein